MKALFYFFCAMTLKRSLRLILALALMAGCTSPEEQEKLVAHQYCGSCHSFPEPSLLDKAHWQTVMPQMAFRMGIDLESLMMLSEGDFAHVVQTLPKSPMISHEDFEKIKRYYDREAPDSLELPEPFVSTELAQFEATPFKVLGQRPTITLLRADTVNQSLYIANRKSMFYKVGFDFKVKDSIKLTSPPSDIIMNAKGPELLTLMGIMDPNDQPLGSVVGVNGKQLTTLADSIKRPVFMERADLDNDGQQDLVVCAFGNYSGGLHVLQKKEDRYVRHTIASVPGSRKVIIRDFNSDGLADILTLFAQGDEQIVLYTNAGNFNFRVTTLLKFPPVYGSSYFDIADFNNDGFFDVLYANGDNADYSITLKPYHGFRIFLNDGKNSFKESWFQSAYGASVAMAKDFDSDGDLDIVGICFFPDFRKTPERSFIYFENNGKGLEFTPQTTKLGADGRWLLMESVDIDGDKDQDVILGALDFDTGIPQSLVQQWTNNPVDLLLLRNKAKK